MKQVIRQLGALMLLLTAGAYSIGAVTNVELADAGFYDNKRLVSITNNESVTQVVGVGGTATLIDGTTETATSTPVSVRAGETVTVMINYSQPLATIHDDIYPF